MQNRRSFRISDSLVLIAATAAGIAISRDAWPYHFQRFSPGGEAYRDGFAHFLGHLWRLGFIVSHFVAPWTLAILALWLRKPRPRLMLLARRPGFVATVVAAVVLSIRMVNVGMDLWASAAVNPGEDLMTLYSYMHETRLIPLEAGCAVAAAWIVQVLGGRWVSESTWLDRTGRALGLFWVGTILLSWFSFVVWAVSAR